MSDRISATGKVSPSSYIGKRAADELKENQPAVAASSDCGD